MSESETCKETIRSNSFYDGEAGWVVRHVHYRGSDNRRYTAFYQANDQASAEVLADALEQHSYLKRKLSDSIAREQEIERELEECEKQKLDVIDELHSANNRTAETRARADALVEAIMYVKCDCHMEPLEHGTHMAGCNMPKVNELIEAHRQTREEGK